MFTNMSTKKSDRRKRTLEEAVRYFSKCKSKVVVRGNVELQMSLETVKSAAEESGLDPQHITALLDAASSGYFAQSVSRQLIRCLIPTSQVPQEAVVKAISWMSTNKPPVAIQALLLRWILVVYDYIDGYEKLHCLYGILFLFLDSQVMMPHVCHLLFLLTRKEDVKMFRVRKLLSLIKGRVGAQACLTGLLTIYKLYYPNLVSFALPASNRMFFGSYDRKWKSQVREIVEKAASDAQGRASLSDSHNKDPKELSVSRSTQLTSRPPPRKKQRLEVPVAHSSSASTDRQETTDKFSLSVESTKVPFVRIDNFVNLLQHVEKIEFPSQIAACLRDPILQHLMAYSGDRVVTTRFTFWLQHALTEEFLNHSPTNMEENEKLLKMIVDLTDFLQEGVPVIDNFLASFLHTWNGMDYGPFIFRLISRCQMYPISDLNDLILEPLRQLYFCSSVYFKCQCLITLTELLRNYAAYECVRHRDWTAAISLDDSSSTTLKSAPSLGILFPERLNETVQPSAVLQHLTSFINKLAVVGLQAEGENDLLLHVVVNYISVLSSLTEHPGVEHIILPCPHLVRFVLFSNSAPCISRMAAAFCRYKDAFAHIPGRQRESVTAFNEMLVDVCDTLWRNKTFSNPKQGSLKALSVTVVPVLANLGVWQPSSRFSIFQGLAFLDQAWNFFRKTQPPGKKVHPNQLKTVKDAYLKFLQQQHLVGISHFIGTFITRKSSTHRSLAAE